jgi:predicted nucleotidyltransferase
MKNKETVIRIAKTIIKEELERSGYKVIRILLFGSRAKGEERPDSDWDFFVITDKEPPYPERWDIAMRITYRFVEAGFSGDVIIQSEDVVKERARNTGFLTYYVLKEGVEI